MSFLQDLDDYKLQAEFHTRPDIILHRSYRADWGRGRKKIVVEEKWAPQMPALGAGSFGIVRLERRQDTNGETQYTHRAVKQLRKVDMARMRVDFRKELVALTKFSRSKFIQSQAFVRFFGWFEDIDHIFIAMEYFEQGTLDGFIKEALLERDAQVIGLQLLEGLRIMHEEQFTHRDLKPQNIFVVQQSPNWWVKIGDFGISKRVANNDTALRTSTGTPNYLAPEIFHYVSSLDEEGDAYTNAVDIWSFGCVVYEMMALQVPFVDWPRNLVAFCRGGQFPDDPLRSRTSAMGIEFIKSILIPSPAERPTAEEALESSWFQIDVPDAINTSSTPISTRGFEYESVETLKRVHADPDTASTLRLGRSSYLGIAEANTSELAGTIYTPSRGSDFDPMNKVVDSINSTVSEGRFAICSKEEPNVPRILGIFSCDNCKKPINGDYHHCSVCNNGSYNICKDCVRNGNHCAHQDHWMVKRHIESGKVINSATEIVSTPWVLSRVDGAPDRKEPPPITLSSRRWRASYKKDGRTMYDYCFQCGFTFPVNDPPHRHVWESHCTVDIPTQEVDESAKETSPALPTRTWTRMPLPDEQELHDEKMLKMEAEMKTVFKQKVAEKQDKMEKNEVELYLKHREMKGQLERQRMELVERLEKKKKPQSTKDHRLSKENLTARGPAARAETPLPDKEKKKRSFFWGR